MLDAIVTVSESVRVVVEMAAGAPAVSVRREVVMLVWVIVVEAARGAMVLVLVTRIVVFSVTTGFETDADG